MSVFDRLDSLLHLLKRQTIFPGADVVRHLTAVFEELGSRGAAVGASEDLCNAFKFEVLPSLQLGYWGDALYRAIVKHSDALRIAVEKDTTNG